MSAPDSGSRAMPCPPPTIHDQSSMTWTSWPRPARAWRVSAETRPSASTRRSRYTRTRGASMASWMFMPNSSTLRSICVVVWAEDVGRLRIATHPLEDIVQPQARAGHGEARAEGHPERLGHGRHGPLGIRAGEVGGLLVHEAGRVSLPDLPREPLAAVGPAPACW